MLMLLPRPLPAPLLAPLRPARAGRAAPLSQPRRLMAARRPAKTAPHRSGGGYSSDAALALIAGQAKSALAMASAVAARKA